MNEHVKCKNELKCGTKQSVWFLFRKCIRSGNIPSHLIVIKQPCHEDVEYNAYLHCALSLAAQCIVIGPVCLYMCLFVGLFVCLWVCYHDNSKLSVSIFTKLGLYVKVLTISSWLNFGRPAPRERGLRRGKSFWLRLTTASAQCLRISDRFFHYK